MVLVKLGLPKEENIVTRNKFITNKIIPIAIRNTNVNDQFIILFVAFQDYDDSYIFLQLLVKAENQFDYMYLKNHNLNISQFSENKDLNSKEQTRLEAYKQFIDKMNNTNVYATDLQTNKDINYPLYYHFSGVKAIDKSHASVLDIYLPIDNFIKIKVYLNRMISKPFELMFHESVFSDEKFHNIEIVNIETVKLDCTKCVDRTLSLGINKVNNAEYTTHYTMNCGPSKFVLNFTVVSIRDKIIKFPLDANLYDTFYSTHHEVKDFFLDDNHLFIIYEENSLIDGSFKKMKVLKLKPELIDKTNFVDFDKIFVKKGEI